MRTKPFHVNIGGAYKLYNGPNKVYAHELTGDHLKNTNLPRAAEPSSGMRAHYGELVSNNTRTRVHKALTMASMAKPLSPVESAE